MKTSCGRIMCWIALAVMPAIFSVEASAQRTGQTEFEVKNCAVYFAQQVKVPALETGRVAEVNVVLNEMIESGAAIARLDDRSLKNLKRRAQSELRSARRAASDETRAMVAKKGLAKAQEDLNRNLSMRNEVRGAVPYSQIRDSEHAVELRKADLALAERLQRDAEDEVELREIELAQIDEELRNLQSVSPIGGVVLGVNRSAGEWIERGETIATVARIDRLHVRAVLSSDQISPAMCRNQPISVHWRDPITGTPRSLRGKVLSVDPQLLSNDQFRLHAEVENRRLDNDPTQWILQPGAAVTMKVYASVAKARKLDTLKR